MSRTVELKNGVPSQCLFETKVQYSCDALGSLSHMDHSIFSLLQCYSELLLWNFQSLGNIKDLMIGILEIPLS